VQKRWLRRATTGKKKQAKEKFHSNRKGSRDGDQTGSGADATTEDETSARAKVYFGYDLAGASDVRGECSSEHSEEEFSQDGFTIMKPAPVSSFSVTSQQT